MHQLITHTECEQTGCAPHLRALWFCRPERKPASSRHGGVFYTRARCSRGPPKRVGSGSALTSVLQVVMVLLVFHWEMGLAAQGAERQQARSRSRHRREARGLQS